jgi:hypothetical protein
MIDDRLDLIQVPERNRAMREPRQREARAGFHL